MLLLLLALCLGCALTMAALLVLPYRKRFLRLRDRYAFLLTVMTTAALGSGTLGMSGALLLLGLA